MTLEELNSETEKFKNLLQIQENMKETIINAIHQMKYQQCPKIPLLHQKMTTVKHKMIDALREKCFEDESQDLLNKYKKLTKKGQLKKKYLKKDVLYEEYPFSKSSYIDKYKIINQTNCDESPLDSEIIITSDEETKNPISESEEEELQEEESDVSFYGD